MGSCARKKVYYSKSQAYAAMQKDRTMYRQKVYFYPCPACGWWHLTKENQKERERRKKIEEKERMKKSEITKEKANSGSFTG